jgi:hypothetical protein
MKLYILSSIALISQVSSIALVPTFQNDGNKNIMFAAFTGGSSHYNWVLDIGHELVSRGHNFTFITSVRKNVWDFTVDLIILYIGRAFEIW